MNWLGLVRPLVGLVTRWWVAHELEKRRRAERVAQDLVQQQVREAAYQASADAAARRSPAATHAAPVGRNTAGSAPSAAASRTSVSKLGKR